MLLLIIKTINMNQNFKEPNLLHVHLQDIMWTDLKKVDSIKKNMPLIMKRSRWLLIISLKQMVTI